MQPPRTRRPPSVAPALVAVAVGALALVVVAAGLFLLLRDGGGGDPAPAPATAAPAPATTAEPGGARRVPFELRPGGGDPVRVQLEVAATPAQRRLGLMNRAELADGTGMVFLFPEDVDGGFWMKGTLIPLSIAFVDADGTVVAVREMTPCRADPCPVYRPGGAYRYAVELPARAFPEAGIGPGDEVVAVDPAALPTPS